MKPHEINCSGIFGKMNNIAWTNKGPILPQDLPIVRLVSLSKGEELVVSHVDKFPYMVNYTIPQGVRVVSGSLKVCMQDIDDNFKVEKIYLRMYYENNITYSQVAPSVAQNATVMVPEFQISITVPTNQSLLL